MLRFCFKMEMAIGMKSEDIGDVFVERGKAERTNYLIIKLSIIIRRKELPRQPGWFRTDRDEFRRQAHAQIDTVNLGGSGQRRRIETPGSSRERDIVSVSLPARAPCFDTPPLSRATPVDGTETNCVSWREPDVPVCPILSLNALVGGSHLLGGSDRPTVCRSFFSWLFDGL